MHGKLTAFDEAAAFLDLLDSTTKKFTFQTFDDNKERKEERRQQGIKEDPFARILHGTLEQHYTELKRLNDDGAGVFVTINETDFRGRKLENIVRVRAHFLDLDGAPLEPVLAETLTPHIVTETSPGKWHVYWRVDAVSLDQWVSVQKALAMRFSGDPSMDKLTGVMRLPGFYHRKGEPFMVRIERRSDAPTYPRLGEIKADGEDTPKGRKRKIKAQWRKKLNAAAMEDFPAWVPKLFPGVRRSGEAWTVSATELQRNTQEGLSFHPKGIKDFGLHDIGDPRKGKRTALEVVQEWGRLTGLQIDDEAAAAEWLSGVLGLEPDEDDSQGERQATVLIQLALETGLFHTAAHRAYADIVTDGHRETWSIRSRDFKLWLSREYFHATGKTPGREAINSALDQIEARARFDAPERGISVRVGRYADKIYLDLCDRDWRAVEIDADGWRVVATPPLRFRRAPGMGALPLPERGGSIDKLRPFLNVSCEEDYVLIVAWLLAALRDVGPYPILAVSGEQGSAKTFLCWMMRRLIDANIAPNRTLPREELDLYIAANNGHMIAFDNVSGMPHWISDALCRLSTGGGFAKRQLYTDEDETLLEAQRPVIVNGIEDCATRADFADRSIVLVLEPISDESRRSQQGLEAEFDAARPAILGALLDAIATGLRMLPTTRLERLPRMADFALWVAACEPALWAKGTFEAAYNANRNSLVETVIEASPVAGAVRAFVDQVGKWEGTATELLSELNYHDHNRGIRRDRKHWPQTAKLLSGQLRRVAPMLRRSGVQVEFDKTTARRLVRLEKKTQEDAEHAGEDAEMRNDEELPF